MRVAQTEEPPSRDPERGIRGELIFDVNYKQWNLYVNGTPPHLRCSELIQGNPLSIENYKNGGRVVMFADPPLPMDCHNLKTRIESHAHYQHPANIPFAVARNVFQDYLMQEYFLGINYSPNNSYCYAFDVKSPVVYKTNMRTMANCFDNVHVLDEEFNFGSTGQNQDLAHYRCIQILLKRPTWSYVLMLQNNDVTIKTNSEISQILRAANGTQLIGRQSTWELKGRYDSDKVFNAKSIRLYKNESGLTFNQLHANITIVKAMNEAFLSRQFLEAMTERFNMERLIHEFNNPSRYGVDEFMFSSIVFASHLGLPGQTKNICMQDDFGPVRYNIWSFENPNHRCQVDYIRHLLCIFTVEYLHTLSYRPEIIANKVLASDDFGTVLCVGEMLKERANRNSISPGLIKYKYIPQVLELQGASTNEPCLHF